MSRPRITFIKERYYKYACYYYKHVDDVTLKKTFIGYVTIERRNKQEAIKCARELLKHKVDVVNLYSIRKVEKSLNYCNPLVKELVDKYGEIRESEELVND